VLHLWASIPLPMVIFISKKMKVAMWTLELGLVDWYLEVAPVARPGHPRVCGREKSPEGVQLLLLFMKRNKASFQYFCNLNNYYWNRYNFFFVCEKIYNYFLLQLPRI
jgi:hypothetical protein